MTARQFATGALTAALVVWLLKAGVIALAGGLGRSRFEGPLFFLGLLLFVVGAVTAGVSLAPRRTPGSAILAGFGAFAVGSVLFAVAGLLVSLIAPSDAHWAWGEANLWIASGVAVVVWLSVQDGLDAT